MNIQDWFTLGPSVHHLLYVATQEYLPTELWYGSLSWCPAHRKCWVSISSAPWLYEWLSQHLWTWVAAGRHLCPPHSMAQALLRFPPFLLCSMLEESGEVTHAERRKQEKREHQSLCFQGEQKVSSFQRCWKLREKPEPEIEVDWQGTNKGKPKQHIIMQRHYFTNKGLSSQSYGFSSSHVWMWELDY